MQSPTNSNTYGVESPSSSSHRGSPDVPVKQEHHHHGHAAIMESTTVSPVACSNNDPKDDLDIVLLHEDFPILVALAAKVKETRKKMAAGGVTPQHPLQVRPKTKLQPDAVLQSVDRMQQTFLARPDGRHETIPRGRYPVTDAILEESLLLLQNEFECGEMWLQQQQTAGSTAPAAAAAAAAMPTGAMTTTSQKKRGRKTGNTSNGKEAIAIKYSKWQTDILMNWMIAHKDQPFPDQQAIESLMQRTGLSQSQVVNWTTNVRKRNRKATCEGGKKPHHFIDFLFLAQDREEKQQQQLATEAAAAQSSLLLSSPPPSSQPSDPLFRQPPTQPVYSGHHPNHQTPRDDSSEQVLDTCISRDIFDEVEPLPVDAKTEESLMAEFAQDWLHQKDRQHQPDDLGLATLDDNFLDFMDNTDTNTTNASDEHHRPGPALLPSVTDDSHEQQQGASSATRPRIDSMEHIAGLGMEDDDIQKWVEENGLAGTED